MKKQLFFALLATLTIFTACEKNNDDNDSNGSGSSKLLKRIIETEDGVNTTYNFTYDDKKRVTSFKNGDNSEVTNITYDANGNVTKIENKEVEEKNVLEVTYNNGVPVSGVFKTYEMNGSQQGELASSMSFTYTVANGLVTQMKALMEDEEDEEDVEINYTFTYTNGNLTKVQTDGFLATTTTFTYGNKKPMFPASFKYIIDPGGLSLQFFAKNEILTTTFDAPGTTLDKTITNTYTYDANGYVLTSNDGETQIKYEYQ